MQLSPSCWAHALQHSQPSVTRLTPSGQRGGAAGHSHGHLQNWGRDEVSSRGAGVGPVAVGAGGRACGGRGDVKQAARKRGPRPKAGGRLPIFTGFQRFTSHSISRPCFRSPDTACLLTSMEELALADVKPAARTPLLGRAGSASVSAL